MEDLSHYLRLRPRHRHWVLGGAGSLLLLAGWLTVQTFAAHAASEAALEQAEVLRAARVKRPPPKLSLSDLDLRKRWTAMQAEREFAWKPVFTALERAASPEIELLEFDPDKVSRQLTLSGEARDERALVAFLDALAAQPLFSHVHLTHQQKKVRDRLLTITFELKATLAR